MSTVIRRTRAILALMLAIVLTGCSVSGGGRSSDIKEIKLGFIGPVTGSAADNGKQMQAAAELAVEELNKAGGMEIGGKKYRIKLVVADTEGAVAERATSALQRLIEQDQVMGVVGFVFSSNVLAAAPLAQRSKVPLINTVGAALTIPEKIASDKMDFIFSVSLTTEEWAQSMAGTLAKYVRPKKVAVLQLNTDSARALEKALRAQLAAAMPGVEMTFLYKEPTLTDFNPEILKIKEFNPDAIIFHHTGTPSFAFVDQLYDSGLSTKTVVLGTGDYSAPDFLTKTGVKTNLHLSHAITLKAKITPLTEPFHVAYEQYAKKPASYYSVQQYDGMLMMFEGMKRMEGLTGNLSKDRQALRDALDSINEQKPTTATRGNLFFQPVAKGHRVIAASAVVQVQDGQRVLLWPTGSGTGTFKDPRK